MFKFIEKLIDRFRDCFFDLNKPWKKRLKKRSAETGRFVKERLNVKPLIELKDKSSDVKLINIKEVGK